MSGDIEDFLRRAAERRQARQANKSAPPATASSRPEYSDTRRERTPQARDDDDELVVAEVIEEPLSRKLAELKRAQATAQAMREASGRTESQPGPSGSPPIGGTHSAESQRPATRASILSPSRSTASQSVTSQAPGPDLQSVAIGDLHEALKTPQGLRSAILMHEILDRPEHRW